MTRDPGQTERLLMMSRLPELARILRNVFVEEKKPALIMEVACSRMVASYRSALSPGGFTRQRGSSVLVPSPSLTVLSPPGDMEKHIRLLAEVAADWLAVRQVRKEFYLKVDKKMELSRVVERLSSRLDEEQNS